MAGSTGGGAHDALRRRLAGDDPPRVVAAVGPDAWLRDDVMRAVAEAVLGDAASPDVVTIQPDAAGDGAVQAASRFLGEARTASLFGGRKVVVLRDADSVASVAKAAFVEWLKAPAPRVTAVLLADEFPKDVGPVVAEHAVVVACGGRGGEPAARFVSRRTAERGKRIGTPEAEMLVEMLGGELGTLDQSVEILCLHAGEEPAVTAAHIDALFRSAREGTVWSFGDLLVEGEVATALAEASRCFDDGVRDGDRLTLDERTIALRLVSSFTSSVSRALALRRQLDAGVERSRLDYPAPLFAKWLPPAAKDRIARAASRRRADALETMLLRAEETERGMKSGGPEGRTAVVRLATAAGLVR